jgi:hypothetical protein
VPFWDFTFRDGQGSQKFRQRKAPGTFFETDRFTVDGRLIEQMEHRANLSRSKQQLHPQNTFISYNPVSCDNYFA